MDKSIEALKLALEALETYKGFIDDAHIIEGQWHWIDGLDNVQTAIKEALAEHAMSKGQRLGQEIEQCQCPECQIKPHASDCAVHSEPAYPKGKCDCGAQPEQEPKIGCVNHDCDKCKAQRTEQEPVIGKWSLREVYFDEDGEPISHRSPPQRKPLTKEEMFEAIRPLYSSDKAARLTVNHSKDEYRAIEAAHGIRENT